MKHNYRFLIKYFMRVKIKKKQRKEKSQDITEFNNEDIPRM